MTEYGRRSDRLSIGGEWAEKASELAETANSLNPMAGLVDAARSIQEGIVSGDIPISPIHQAISLLMGPGSKPAEVVNCEASVDALRQAQGLISDAIADMEAAPTVDTTPRPGGH